VARSERLLELIQLLRRHRWPVSGQALAQELGVSLRTVYRDIQTLIRQGATIDGEAGIGFVLRPGFVLPPLMFSDEELEALVLGSRLVAQRSDAPLARAAMNVMAKIAAVLPDDLREGIADTGLLPGPGPTPRASRSTSRPCGPRSGPSKKSLSTMRTARAIAPGARCGRSRSASSSACACWRHGASCARTFAISAPTASSRSAGPMRTTPAAGAP
jgi:biotin operon repressor